MRTSKKIPAYRHHRARDLAVVTLNGRDHYLGRWQSPESFERYAQLIAAYHRGELLQPQQTGGTTIGDFALRYMDHARRYYVKHGRPTNQVGIAQQALKQVCQLWASLPVAEFSPLKLQAVIAAMVAADLSRSYINKLLTCVKIAVRWGVAQEIIPANVLHGLQAVTGLRRGRTEARETPPVLPVPSDIVEATLKHCGRIVGAMIRLQELTGMRPGELVQIRPVDIEIAGDGCAVFTPRSHKCEHHGRERRIFIGPRGLEILRPFLGRPSEQYCFSPAEASAEHHAERARRRVTPRYRSHLLRNQRKRKLAPRRAPGECFDVHSYARAIARAARRAFPLPRGLTSAAAREFRLKHYWGPNRLRHNFATASRRVAGLEATAAALGHSDIKTSLIYAETDYTVARELLRQIG